MEFIFLERPGYPVKATQPVPGLRLHRCDGHLLAVSSTELRDRTRRLSLDYFVPHKAIVYINEKGLYRQSRHESPPPPSRELVKLCCRALLEKKPGRARVLDVSARRP